MSSNGPHSARARMRIILLGEGLSNKGVLLIQNFTPSSEILVIIRIAKTTLDVAKSPKAAELVLKALLAREPSARVRDMANLFQTSFVLEDSLAIRMLQTAIVVLPYFTRNEPSRK